MGELVSEAIFFIIRIQKERGNRKIPKPTDGLADFTYIPWYSDYYQNAGGMIFLAPLP
jgi:hypothetical protein